MSHILDRPAWSALTTRHADLAEGGALARRYPQSIVPFAATGDDGSESLASLASLVPEDGSVLLVQAADIVLPPGCVASKTAAGVQMTAVALRAPIPDEHIRLLGEEDAADMLELATLTKPGPFTLRAQCLGKFWGIRIDGRLAAMAGERMKQTGWSELSGVAVHPDFRGRGFARLLSLHVAGQIQDRGETPYLHVYATNAAAIALYESIGFRIRSAMNVAVVELQQAA